MPANTLPQSFTRPKYRADVDGMRALAILAVLFFHAYPSSLPGGFVGVDVFFVISGYLISSIIFRGLTSGSFSFFDFYARRVRRIFPAVTIVFLASFVIGIFFVSPYVMNDMIREAPYAAFFVENIRLFLQHGQYWDVGTGLKPYMHFWSLGVEEQYYIFYPLICFFLWKASPKVFLLSLLGMLFLSFGLCLYDTVNEPIRAFYMLHTRFWELLIGGVLAYVELKWPNYKQEFCTPWNSQKFDNILSVVGLLLIVVAIVFFHEGEDFPGWRALFPTVGAVLIIMAGSGAYLNKNLFANKVAVFIGLISYPLYLWHWPLIAIARNNLAGELPTGSLMVGIIVLSFVFAYLTYTLIERPMRSMKASWKLVLALVFILLLSTLGVKQVTRKNDLLEDWMFNNLPPEVLVERPPHVEPYDTVCTQKFGRKTATCRAFGDDPKVLIFGDSHANVLLNYLQFNPPKESVYLLASPGATVFDNVSMVKAEEVELHEGMKNLWRVLRESPEIETVVFMGYWANYYKRDMVSDVNPQWSLEEIFKNHWRLTLEEVQRLKKRAVIVLDNPTITEDQMKCLNARLLRVRLAEADVSKCYFASNDITEKEKFMRQAILDEITKWPTVEVVDFMQLLCPKDRCLIYSNNHLNYYDEDHLSHHGVSLVWPELEAAIKRSSQRQ